MSETVIFESDNGKALFDGEMLVLRMNVDNTTSFAADLAQALSASEAAREAAEATLEMLVKAGACDRHCDVSCAEFVAAEHAVGCPQCMKERAEAAEAAYLEMVQRYQPGKVLGHFQLNLETLEFSDCDPPTVGKALTDELSALREQLEDAQIRANDEASKAASVAKDHRRTLEELAEVTRERDAWKRQHDMIISVARIDSLRAEDAERYEQWLLDLGRISGCGHVDERLPRCIEEAFAAVTAERDEAREEAAYFRREVSFQAERLMPEIHSLTEQLTAAQQQVERLEKLFNNGDQLIGKLLYQLDLLEDHFTETGEIQGNGQWRLRSIGECVVAMRNAVTECSKADDAALTESERTNG